MPDKAMLIAMRTANLTRSHPQAVYNYKCDACGEGMCLWPSGQRIVREQGIENLHLCCEVCATKLAGLSDVVLPKELLREARESIDFTKKKQ